MPMPMRSRSFLPAWAVLAAAVLCALPAAAQQPASGAGGGKGAAPPKAETCAACHGPNGNAPQGAYPILAGQTSRYLYLQLRDFQAGRRTDPQMSPMAAGLTPDEMRALADWFASQTPLPQQFKVDPAKAKLGQAKAEETLCSMCHLGGMKGQNEIPKVAGQNHDYVVKQLQDFKAKRRTNDAGNMTSVSSTLSDADIENLAHYLAGL